MRTGRQAPSTPRRGLRFDPEKILLDPYGRAVVVPDGYNRSAASRPGDNTAAAMRSVVVDPEAYDWEGDAPLRRPFSTTVIYEMHVAGFTRHPSSGVTAARRGTYAGMVEKIPYLQDLGITAVELLPVFQFDRQDCPPGLVNYWGYSPVSFFAPHAGYSSRPGPARGRGRVPGPRQGPPPRRHRGDPGRRVQPHGGGRPRRADPLLPGARQRDVLHPGGGPRPLRELQRHRQHAERERRGGAPPDPRQPAVLGGRHARGRLPVRPRLRPIARRVGLPAPAAPHPVGHPVGPGPGGDQAHRRGVGRRRPLPGRPLQRRQLAGVERHGSATTCGGS